MSTWYSSPGAFESWYEISCAYTSDIVIPNISFISVETLSILNTGYLKIGMRVSIVLGESLAPVSALRTSG
ncbi:MAG: hypothetical protein QXQ46_10560 [Thermoplasmatales archaeon]